MEAKTYTKRENAKRAAIAAGVPDELVEITVHKSAEGVRFGWKAMEARAPADEGTPADPVVTTGKPKKEAAPKVERIEQNGVKRPGPGKCLEVWEYLDQHGNMKPKDLQPVSALQQARAKAEELTGAVRSAAFDDWVRRCVVDAQTPSEWTQARTLYESYIAHARRFGDNRAQRSQSVLALATETQWGRMMATLFVKKRRSAGWYYPLRCKRGG